MKRRPSLSGTLRLTSSKVTTASPDSHDLPHLKRPTTYSVMPATKTTQPTPKDSSAGREDIDNSDQEKPFASRDGSVVKHLGTMMEKLDLHDGMDKVFNGKVCPSCLQRSAH